MTLHHNQRLEATGASSREPERAGDLFTYFAYRDSWLHRLDPRVKALWVLTGLLYIFTTDDWRALLVLLGANLALAASARFSLRVFWPVLRALALFGLVILVFQLLFQSGEVWLTVGPIRLHAEGFYVTRQAWLRLANLSLFGVEFMMWTHPADIALMWISFGLRYRYAMLGGLALRFFPVLQQEVGRILEAQQVRGQPLQSPLQRIRGLVSIVLPLVLRVLRRTNEVALSMELRGFGYGPTRTHSRQIRLQLLDKALLAGLVGLWLLRAWLWQVGIL
jgi:energy-coupling factor transport system permease protein